LAKQEQTGGGANLPSAQDGAAGMGARGAARRRFGKAGLGASGVILTLASQPGMASTVCRTASGFVSATANPNHVNSHAPQMTCGGVSPGFWKNKEDHSPGTWMALAKTDPQALFSKVFGTSRTTSGLNGDKLIEVVDATKVTEAVDNNRVAMHIVAALLNARAGYTSSVLNEAQVREIWAQYALNGYYTYKTGAKPWYGDMIVQYLKSTFSDV
jgi:hypothetical protein